MPATLHGARGHHQAAACTIPLSVAFTDNLPGCTYSMLVPCAATSTHWVPQPAVGYWTSLAIAGSLVAGTCAGYAKAWACYNAWRIKVGVLLKHCFLAMEPVICMFAASYFGTASGLAAQKDIASIWAQHVAVNTPWLSSP
jgi:hypothetical protein